MAQAKGNKDQVIGTCWFCGAQNVTLTGEHVWSDWISKAIELVRNFVCGV